MEDETRNSGAGGGAVDASAQSEAQAPPADAQVPAETPAETTSDAPAPAEAQPQTQSQAGVQLSAEAQATLEEASKNAERIVEMGRKLEAAEAALKSVRDRERRQAVRRMLEVRYPDVAPFALSAAENLLLSAEGDGPNAGAFELSATGEASIKEGSIGEQVKSMLDACKQKVETGRERGNGAPPANQDSMSKGMEKHAREYAQYLRLAGVDVPDSAQAPAAAASTTSAAGGGE